MTDENTGWGAPPVATIAPVADAPKFPVKYKCQPDTIEPETWLAMRNAAIQHWIDGKAKAVSTVENERDLRVKVVDMLFPEPKKGTNKYDVGGGYTVRLVYGLVYKLGDKDKVDESEAKVSIETQIRAVEDAIIDEFGEVGDQILKRLITWKPELSGSTFEKLDSANPTEMAIRDKLSEVLTISPAGTPQLFFDEPKAK